MRHVHKHLMRKHYWYAKWHHKPYYNFYHWIILLGIAGLAIVSVYSLTKQDNIYLSAAADSPYSSASVIRSKEPILTESYYVIFVTENGFEPSKALIDENTIILWENVGNVQATIQFDARQELRPVLNVGTILPGESKKVLLEKEGEYIYYNSYKPEQKAIIEVRSLSSGS